MDVRARDIPVLGSFSAGTWVVVGIALLSTLAVGLVPEREGRGRTMWLFAQRHHELYAPIIQRWNETQTSGPKPGQLEAGVKPTEVTPRLMSMAALERRMLGAFLSDMPSADLIEVERKIAGRAFTGPLDRVGFVDLTDRLRDEGLMDRINAPSFGPWTSRGRIFGLPHDVHPVLLGYRADVVEAAGIDMAAIETWDDFERMLRPLMDSNGDGKSDRFLLNLAPNNADHLEVLLLQAGGGFFDDADRAVVASEVNARVLARLARWIVGPDPIAADAPNFSLAGNQLKARGHVLTGFFPDWMGDIWLHEIPDLAGKMKLMPMPAWQPGGRRTSVWGGTMMGIPKAAAKDTESFEGLWRFAKHLYLSDELARRSWTEGSIITPAVEHWSDPVFDQPRAYFSGQATGRMYIQQAPHVPARSSSPFNSLALSRTQRALENLCREAKSALDDGKPMDEAALRERAMVHLREADRQVREAIQRNVFLAAPGVES